MITFTARLIPTPFRSCEEYKSLKQGHSQWTLYPHTAFLGFI